MTDLIPSESKRLNQNGWNCGDWRKSPIHIKKLLRDDDFNAFSYILIRILLNRRKFKAKLPTIWTDEKAVVGRVRKEKKRSRKIREEKEKKKGCRCTKR